MALHRSQILQVHLEFSIMKQHQGLNLYLEALNLSGSFIVSLREFLNRDFSVQALCLSMALRDPLSRMVSGSFILVSDPAQPHIPRLDHMLFLSVFR